MLESEKDMTLEFDEKGKIFTDVVSKIAIPAVIQTTEQLIKGNVHVRRDERLKDELDRDELFLAMTDAVIIGEDGQVHGETPTEKEVCQKIARNISGLEAAAIN